MGTLVFAVRTNLVKDSAVVRGDIVRVKKEAFFHCRSVGNDTKPIGVGLFLHRLKLVTGVDISTRPVRRSGREGNAKKRRSLRAAAEPKSNAFRRSITIAISVSALSLGPVGSW